MRRLVLLAAMLLATTGAGAQSFKVKERTDALTKDRVVEAGDLKLCQTKDSGFAAKCAQLRFVWLPKSPEFVLVRIDIPEITSVLNASINVNGEVKSFSSSEPVTDISIYQGLGVSGQSGNVFIVPLSALQSLVQSPEYGVLRVTGSHSRFDFDFWRKAKAKGLPADELKELLKNLDSRRSSAN